MIMVATVAFAVPAFAQHPAARGGGGGHFPSGPPHGPAPYRAPAPAPVAHPGVTVRAPEPVQANRPHVEKDARWVGHETGGEDPRYHVGRPFPHGHFSGAIGNGHTYRLSGWDPHRHRFWFGSSFFLVAQSDVDYVDDWDWSTDQVVLYDDPDHPGWYLAYNSRLGTYAHVEYDGPLQ